MLIVLYFFSIFFLNCYMSPDKVLAVGLHGSMTNSEQLRVFQRAPAGVRKVVVATNITETSITIPGIVYGEYCVQYSMIDLVLRHKLPRKG